MNFGGESCFELLCRCSIRIDNDTILFTDAPPAWAIQMPHHVRTIAKGRPAFVLGTMIWSDDVSGNVSKQYNAHTNVYIANLNLPHEKLQQEYFVRFSSTSQNASSSEQLHAVCKDL